MAKEIHPYLLELSYKQIGNGDVYLVLDMRHTPPKNVGVIVRRPGTSGWRICPFLRKGLNYKYPKGLFPEQFKTPERAWKWVKNNARGWNSGRKYTFLNFLIAWGAHVPFLLNLIQDQRLHSFIMKVILLIVFAYASDNIPERLRNVCLVLIVGLSLMDIGILMNDRRPNRVNVSNRVED